MEYCWKLSDEDSPTSSGPGGDTTKTDCNAVCSGGTETGQCLDYDGNDLSIQDQYKYLKASKERKNVNAVTSLSTEYYCNVNQGWKNVIKGDPHKNEHGYGPDGQFDISSGGNPAELHDNYLVSGAEIREISDNGIKKCLSTHQDNNNQPEDGYQLLPCNRQFKKNNSKVLCKCKAINDQGETIENSVCNTDCGYIRQDGQWAGNCEGDGYDFQSTRPMCSQYNCPSNLVNRVTSGIENDFPQLEGVVVNGDTCQDDPNCQRCCHGSLETCADWEDFEWLCNSDLTHGLKTELSDVLRGEKPQVNCCTEKTWNEIHPDSLLRLWERVVNIVETDNLSNYESTDINFTIFITLMEMYRRGIIPVKKFAYIYPMEYDDTSDIGTLNIATTPDEINIVTQKTNQILNITENILNNTPTTPCCPDNDDCETNPSAHRECYKLIRDSRPGKRHDPFVLDNGKQDLNKLIVVSYQPNVITTRSSGPQRISPPHWATDMENYRRLGMGLYGLIPYGPNVQQLLRDLEGQGIVPDETLILSVFELFTDEELGISDDATQGRRVNNYDSVASDVADAARASSLAARARSPSTPSTEPEEEQVSDNTMTILIIIGVVVFLLIGFIVLNSNSNSSK